MEEQLSNLKRAMDDTVYKGNHFSEEHKVKIRGTIKHPRKKNRLEWFPKLLTVTLFIGCIIFITDITKKNINSSDKPSQLEQRNGTKTEEQSNNEDNWVQKTAIKKVLEQEFTGPNEKLVDLLWNPKYRTVVNNKAENQELDKYLAEVYGPYFADFSRIETFIAADGGTKYHTGAYDNGYKLSLKNITIEQENISYRYTFIAEVGYQKNGDEEKTASVEGEVVFSTKEKEEGKIVGFRYVKDNGLWDILRTSN
ncbi:hypothetical protein QNH20_24880 [Neobacillus sp. WH10]|uniref:hypothetical protein n=1 Tax=Neobacillus sp. WH10 TaxID=3047873 RepID=UPI0024C1A52C|nr:hypothetical protein [Neobacillus sp. WH10]WHY77269.1 hypothetical protein QNH20_24880 [Neobacillus sp. WH10]